MVQGRIATIAGNRFTRFLRTLLFEKIQLLSMSSVQKKSTGDLMGRINNDVAVVQNFITNLLPTYFAQLLSFFLGLVLILSMSPVMSAFVFIPIPFVCFTVLSGLQSIDSSYYEAALVDGANYWQKLFNITLPLVKPSLTVATVLNIIYVFNSFPIVWTITKGDPANRTDTLVTYLYKLAFYNGKQGEAAAVSVIGFLILLVCASVYMVSTLKKGDE